jgi:surface antigen
MYQQTGLFLYRFRFLLATMLTIAFLVLISAIVTAVGAGTVLAHPSSTTLNTDSSSSPNVVTSGVSALGSGIESSLLSVGSDLYGTCRSITTMTSHTGDAIGHGSAAIVGGVANGIGKGIIATTNGIGSTTLFTVRMPGRIFSSVFSGHAETSLIEPADSDPVPIISAETSDAALAFYGAQQQEEVAQWQAAQLAANQSLDGAVVAGDPTHGGYPAKWADAPQDSMLDSWGMYNRECVSYAAWKVYQTYGSMPYWGGVGNANQWPDDARRAGVATGTTPQANSVAISMAGYYGHAMWVEKVSGDMIYVSQYNYDLRGDYSEMWVNGSRFTYIYFK